MCFIIILNHIPSEKPRAFICNLNNNKHKKLFDVVELGNNSIVDPKTPARHNLLKTIYAI